MTVNFCSSKPVFRAENPTETCKCEHRVCPDCGKPIADTYNGKETLPEKKQGVLTKTKNGFIKFRKFFIDLGQMTLGAAKGAFYGAAAGGTVLAVDAVRNIAKKAPKNLSTKGKVIAGAAAAVAVGYNLVKAKLTANDKKATLDHRWETGHNG